jgi:hypothetical protein
MPVFRRLFTFPARKDPSQNPIRETRRALLSPPGPANRLYPKVYPLSRVPFYPSDSFFFCLSRICSLIW